MLDRWLAHPRLRGLDLDDPRTTEARREIIRENRFLRHLYEEWYTTLAATLPPGPGALVELGSGAGFLADYVPHLVTSEVFLCYHIRVVLNGCYLPFPTAALRGILMTDVLHHVPDVRRFFAEAARCVRPGGVVAMIEPWVTRWSRFVYGYFHHEPFRPESVDWKFPSKGPLSDANGALPWMIFERDCAQFVREFPQWQIETIRPMMPFRYLVSGGVSRRGLMPGWSFEAWRRIDEALDPWMNTWAMFALILLRRETPHEGS